MSEPREHNRRSDDGWHVKKALDYGHIITTFLIGASVLNTYFSTVSDFDKRMALLEQSQKAQEQVSADVRELRDVIGPLVVKLDAYIDRKDREDQRQWDHLTRRVEND